MVPPPTPKASKQGTLEIYNFSRHEVTVVDELSQRSTTVSRDNNGVISPGKRIFTSPRLTLSSAEDWSIPIKLRRPLRGPPSSWAKINVEPSELVVYYAKVSNHTKRLIIFSNRDLSCFMRDLPDSTHLSEVVIPGTHDSVSFYGWPFAQCQNPRNRLLRQLESGVRFVDVRLSVVNNALISYHGPIKQHTLFTDIVDTLYNFLRSERGKDECIVMSIKQEDFAKTPWQLFSDLVRQVVYHRGDEDGTSKAGQQVTSVPKSLAKRSAQSTGKDQPPPTPNPESSARKSKDMWWLQNRVPTLGEARGKIIMFSRFGVDGTGWDDGLEGLGIHPTNWPNSRKEGFEWVCKDTTFKMHDWYDIKTFFKTPEKFVLSSDVLKMPLPSLPEASLVEPNALPIPFPSPKQYTLPFSYTSASSIPLALPSTIACGFGIWKWGFDGVNARLGEWLLKYTANHQIQRSGISETPDEAGEKKPLTTVKDQGTTDTQIRGWVLMDYLDEPAGVGRLLVELNFFS
ncbi:hypothetical protein FRC03_000040 [Tulasnella sp. 419]|nr:hypothetical protein FRC03_000040 [Tulasnella sp. 419]